MIAFGLMLAAAGIIMLIIGAAQAAQRSFYAKASGTVTGAVLEKHRRSYKNRTSYELKVSYTVDGIPYQRYVPATQTEYQDLSEGDEIELVYKPGNPKKAVRPEALDPRGVRIPLLIGIGLTVVGVALVFIGRMLIAG